PIARDLREARALVPDPAPAGVEAPLRPEAELRRAQDEARVVAELAESVAPRRTVLQARRERLHRDAVPEPVPRVEAGEDGPRPDVVARELPQRLRDLLLEAVDPPLLPPRLRVLEPVARELRGRDAPARDRGDGVQAREHAE